MTQPYSSDAPDPPWLVPRAAYVHVPFCAHHCGYCDFAIAAGKDSWIELYVDALAAELARLDGPREVDTLFIGGGTPTYLSVPQLGRLLQAITRWLPLRPGGEFTIESNPGTFDADKVGVLADHGVNRLSLGAQSFQPHLLKALERDHRPEDVPRAVESARAHIDSISIDLIFAVPGQTLPDWQEDLNRALALGPDHLSTYGLTFEKGTPLWKQQQRGQVEALDEDLELALYEHAMDRLAAAGFEHYEISNHALPGRRSRHNQVYWANEAYWGFGMGAARYVAGRRDLNTRDLQGYIRKCLAGESVVFQSEMLEPRERAVETMALQLRRGDGIDRPAFAVQTGHRLDDLVGEAIAHHLQIGLLAEDGPAVRLTRRGRCVADAVIRSLMRTASRANTPPAR
ncbi:MAG: radical SAM family heme chaperone HemW [Gemmataceae bacterium]